LLQYGEGIEVGSESLVAADVHNNFPNFELLEDQFIKEDEIELQADPSPEMGSPPRSLGKPLNNNATMEARHQSYQPP